MLACWWRLLAALLLVAAVSAQCSSEVLPIGLGSYTGTTVGVPSNQTTISILNSFETCGSSFGSNRAVAFLYTPPRRALFTDISL